MKRWLVLSCVLASSSAAADVNDIVLSRLATEQMDGTFIAQNADLRSLSSQLGVVLAPRLSTPADTLGFGGFQFTVDYATTTIDSSAAYWRAREGSPDPAGAGGQSHGPGSLQTIGMFARKGLWFPVPAFEVGAGALHLVDSSSTPRSGPASSTPSSRSTRATTSGRSPRCRSVVACRG